MTVDTRVEENRIIESEESNFDTITSPLYAVI